MLLSNQRRWPSIASYEDKSFLYRRLFTIRSSCIKNKFCFTLYLQMESSIRQKSNTYSEYSSSYFTRAMLNPKFHTYEFVIRVKIPYEFLTHVWQIRANISHTCENSVLYLNPPSSRNVFFTCKKNQKNICKKNVHTKISHNFYFKQQFIRLR